MVAPYVVVAAAAYGIYYLTRGSVEAAQGRGNVQRVTYDFVFPSFYRPGPLLQREFVALSKLADKVIVSGSHLPPASAIRTEQASYGYWAEFNTIKTKVTTGHRNLTKKWGYQLIDPKTGKVIPNPGPRGTAQEWDHYNNTQYMDTNNDGRNDSINWNNTRRIRRPVDGSEAMLTLNLAWHQGPGTAPYDAKGNSVAYDVSQYLTNLNINPEERHEGYHRNPMSGGDISINPPYFHFYFGDRLLMTLDILEHDFDPMKEDTVPLAEEHIMYPDTGKEPMMIQTIKKNHFRFPIRRVYNVSKSYISDALG